MGHFGGQNRLRGSLEGSGINRCMLEFSLHKCVLDSLSFATTWFHIELLTSQFPLDDDCCQEMSPFYPLDYQHCQDL